MYATASNWVTTVRNTAMPHGEGEKEDRGRQADQLAKIQTTRRRRRRYLII